jgi:hypothetical protein
MRQIIGLPLSCALLIAGVWVLYEQIFVSDIIWGRVLMAGGFLIAVGGGWLFGDFILPMLRRIVS